MPLRAGSRRAAPPLPPEPRALPDANLESSLAPPILPAAIVEISPWSPGTLPDGIGFMEAECRRNAVAPKNEHCCLFAGIQIVRYKNRNEAFGLLTITK